MEYPIAWQAFGKRLDQLFILADTSADGRKVRIRERIAGIADRLATNPLHAFQSLVGGSHESCTATGRHGDCLLWFLMVHGHCSLAIKMTNKQAPVRALARRWYSRDAEMICVPVDYITPESIKWRSSLSA